MKNILAAIDYSDDALNVLQTSVDLTKALNGNLCIAHIGDPLTGSCILDGSNDSGKDSILEQNHLSEDHICRIQKWLFQKNVQGNFIFIRGLTVKNILSAIERFGADMVVIGAHHRSRFYHLLFGDVNEALIHQSPCPVLVVPSINGTWQNLKIQKQNHKETTDPQNKEVVCCYSSCN